MRRLTSLLALLFIGLTGCGSGGSNEPYSDPNRLEVGLWRGTWTYKEHGDLKDQGTAEVVLSQDGIRNLVTDAQLTSTNGGVTRLHIDGNRYDWTIERPGTSLLSYSAGPTGSGGWFGPSIGFAGTPLGERTLQVYAPIYYSPEREYRINALKVRDE
jgi:hypothetical protein